MERRILILLITFFPSLAGAQDKTEFHASDSISLHYYLRGDWDSVINLGEKMLSHGMDYKFIRQRLGYAYFIKKDFTAAKANLKKAFWYDSFNPFTIEYLFYSFLNTGKEEYSGPIEEKLDKDLAARFNIRKFKAVENIDAEFNYKLSGSALRSGAKYYRFGLGSKLGYRLRLYQSFSRYDQSITTPSSARLNIIQPEYYARLGWNVSESLILSGAYHFIHVLSGNQVYNGNLFLIDVAPDLDRFILETEGSYFRISGKDVWQTGIQAGYIFPGTAGFYLKGTGNVISNSGNKNFIYGTSAGLKIWKDTWFDASVLSGEMDRYNDFRGMYVYNSYDPMILRSGATINYYAGNKIVFWINFSLERKKYLEDNTFRYNQFSYLGGIKWKI